MSDAELESRRARLRALREAGVDPFPAKVGPRRAIADVRAEHEARDEAALAADPPVVAVCGRVMSQRSFGKLRFFDLLENGTRLQASARRGETPDDVLARLDCTDVGDFLRVEGTLWRTRTGELTVAARDVQVLAKTLRPLPEKWHGLADVETRFRARYLDLLVNESARRIALVRSRAVAAMRSFLNGRGFLEVETPVLQPLYGGAAARPFTTHYQHYEQTVYLRISDELYLKRLIVAGLDRVYEIGHNFRNEGISRKHNPEFTMMECYQAYADHADMMDLVEAMFGAIAQDVLGGFQTTYQGQAIDFSPPWPRLPMHEAIAAACGIDILSTTTNEDLAGAIRAKGLDVPAGPSWGRTVDELFSAVVEPTLVQPTFVTSHPVELSPLAKRCATDPRLVERFECFVAGMELGNAFSELNDPDDQRARFEAMHREAEAGDDEAHPTDEDFLRALEHGMPPTGGLGVGVDRLVMVLADAPNLRETILFPHMKPEHAG